MPEIPQALGGSEAGPALALSRSLLSAEAGGRIEAGQALVARVVRRLDTGRYLLGIAGAQVPVESRLELSPGTQLSLVVRQAGARILLDLVGSAAVASGPPAGDQSPAVQEFATRPATGIPQAHGAGLSAAAKRLDAEVRSLLEATPGLGQAFAEIRALLDSHPPDFARLADALAELSRPPTAASLAALAGTLPERLTELLRTVELLAGRIMAARPGAAGLDALLAELAGQLPPAPAAGAPVGPAQNPDLAALLDRLLPAAPRRDGGFPPGLLAEVRALGSAERTRLAELASAREAALAAASPDLAWLGRAHRALSAARERVGLWQSAELLLSGPERGFSYAEIPAGSGDGRSSARLRVMVSRDPGRGGRPGAGRDARRPVRAVLDLALPELGEVWTELVLSGRELAGRFELPDAARRDLVAAGLPELAGRLEGRGLHPTLAAVERPTPPGRPMAAGSWPDGAGVARVDLWA